MDARQNIHSAHTKALDTQGLRNEFLIEEVFVADEYIMIYSHVDRIIIGDTMSVAKTISVGGEVGKQPDVTHFLERRKLGTTNIGGPGMITVDDQCCGIGHHDALYAGKGAKGAVFASTDTAEPAKSCHNCAPARTTCPTGKATPASVVPVTLGDSLTSNRRAINKYFVSDVLEICQLSMDLTELALDNLWNTVPCYTHERRIEVYSYFDMEEDICVFYMVGQPQKTRHIVMHSEQAVISSNWPIHSGIDIKAYTFIWGVVDENQVFDDMSYVAIKGLCQLRATAMPVAAGIIKN